MNKIKLLLTLSLVMSNLSFAETYWPPQKLTSWSLMLNNGVAYITSPQFAAHCSHSRG
jgi:hypothetical protein